MKIFILLIVTTFASACNKTIPAGFWTDYKKEFLQKNISDQGPYGGHRAMYWKANVENTFASTDLIDFAIENDWTLTDSVFFPLDSVIKWKNTEPTFPFTYTTFSDASMNVSAFPRWINSDLKVYRFKTGWIAVEAGNSRETENNGYIILNPEETELSVYHLWGE